MPITLLQSQAMVILRHLSTRRLHLSIHSSKFRGSPSLSTPLLPSKLQSFPRYASSSQQITAESRSLVTRLQNLLLGTAIGVSLALGYYYVTDTRAGIHQWVVVPSLRWMYDDAEDAHEAGTKALKALYEFGIHPRERGASEKTGDLEVEVTILLVSALSPKLSYDCRSLDTQYRTLSVHPQELTSMPRFLHLSWHSALPSLKSVVPPHTPRMGILDLEYSVFPLRKL